MDGLNSLYVLMGIFLIIGIILLYIGVNKNNKISQNSGLILIVADIILYIVIKHFT